MSDQQLAQPSSKQQRAIQQAYGYLYVFDHLDTCSDIDLLVNTLARAPCLHEQLEAMFNLRSVQS
jgi:hypothetical protein